MTSSIDAQESTGREELASREGGYWAAAHAFTRPRSLVNAIACYRDYDGGLTNRAIARILLLSAAGTVPSQLSSAGG